jgi:hypothetical protein
VLCDRMGANRNRYLMATKSIKVFIALIAVIGVARFALDRYGLPKDIVKYVSMSAVMTVGIVYFGIISATHKDRLKSAYLVILPYMIVEVLALSYTWVTGIRTIFHVPEYSFESTIRVHTIGHLIGGLTWEPLSLFVAMEVVWAIYTGVRRLTLQPAVNS